MSTTQPRRENGTDRADPFTATEPIQELGADALASMREPDALTETGEKAFAVAARVGVMTLSERELEYETTCVLYLTTDGRAVERYFRGGIPHAPRACLVPVRELHRSGLGDRFADTLALHPEV